eukprot:46836-Eustigmatos_ZCMA.PRE.1
MHAPHVRRDAQYTIQCARGCQEDDVHCRVGGFGPPRLAQAGCLTHAPHHVLHNAVGALSHS